jgi:hypothetical protein
MVRPPESPGEPGSPPDLARSPRYSGPGDVIYRLTGPYIVGVIVGVRS